MVGGAVFAAPAGLRGWIVPSGRSRSALIASWPAVRATSLTVCLTRPHGGLLRA